MGLRTQGERDRYTRGVERIADDRVSKFVGPTAEIEFQKAQAIEAALAGSPFTTPKALRCDAAAGRIEFEYVGDMTSLQDFIEQAYATRKLDDVLRFNRAAAELLALIHGKLTLPSAAFWTPPRFFQIEMQSPTLARPVQDDVLLHCDFSPVNILVKPSGQLVLIDASANQYFTDRADLTGPRLVDIATYTAKLYWPFRMQTFNYKWRRVASRLRAEFLAGYEQASATRVDRKLLQSFERAVVRSFINWKTGSRAIRLPAMAIGLIGLPAC